MKSQASWQQKVCSIFLIRKQLDIGKYLLLLVELTFIIQFPVNLLGRNSFKYILSALMSVNYKYSVSLVFCRRFFFFVVIQRLSEMLLLCVFSIFLIPLGIIFFKMFVRSNISYNNGLSILKSCVSYNNCIGLSTILENLFHIFFSYDLKHLQIHCSSIKIILFLFLKHLRHCFIMQSFFTGCHFLYCLWILLMEILIFHNGPVFCKPLFFISIQHVTVQNIVIALFRLALMSVYIY